VSICGIVLFPSVSLVFCVVAFVKEKALLRAIFTSISITIFIFMFNYTSRFLS